jgi:hypothetical protein
MADFTELPVYEGVGDWHFNRFRIAFEPPKRNNAAEWLFTDLLVHFPTFINSGYATAEWGHVKHNGRYTIRFHGYAKVLGINLAGPHSDWVAIESLDPNGVAFTVQTLKREFSDAKEDGTTSVLGAVVANLPLPGNILRPVLGPVVGAILGGGGSTHYNRMHFLAGRRAWRIGYGSVFGLSNDVMVLETVAVERFSAHAFNIADSVIGLKNRVPNVWFAFLYNFVNQMVLKPVDQIPKPRWKKEFLGMHIELSFDNQGSLMADPEFQNAHNLYPRLLPAK